MRRWAQVRRFSEALGLRSHVAAAGAVSAGSSLGLGVLRASRGSRLEVYPGRV
jgi:hypothetical protein